MSRPIRPVLIIMALAWLSFATAATSQSLPRGLPGSDLLQGRGLGGRALDGVSGLTGRVAATAETTLGPPSRLLAQVRRSGGALQADPDGWPVVSGEVLAIGLSPTARRLALDEGFVVVREDQLAALDLTTVVLAPPTRLTLRRAIARLRVLDPAGEYAFNHVHSPAGRRSRAPALADPTASPARTPVRAASGPRLGLIDTGVEATHPALVDASITQRGFAGPARLAGHGTAVASLMVGRAPGFAGGAPGATLFVADVYGGSTTGGSSTALAEALEWLVENEVSVINISLVGPRNALVQAAVRGAVARGVVIVAAVGNDGPAAPVLFPAGYDGVVGVTAVNARDRVLPEAAQGSQVDLAAPGSDMAAAGALSNGGWVPVRGASFAAPLVAGLLAQGLQRPDPGRAASAVAALEATARDLGAPGPDPVFGHGLVGGDLRVAPGAVGARRRL